MHKLDIAPGNDLLKDYGISQEKLKSFYHYISDYLDDLNDYYQDVASDDIKESLKTPINNTHSYLTELGILINEDKGEDDLEKNIKGVITNIKAINTWLA